VGERLDEVHHPAGVVGGKHPGRSLVQLVDGEHGRVVEVIQLGADDAVPVHGLLAERLHVPGLDVDHRLGLSGDGIVLAAALQRCEVKAVGR